MPTLEGWLHDFGVFLGWATLFAMTFFVGDKAGHGMDAAVELRRSQQSPPAKSLRSARKNAAVAELSYRYKGVEMDAPDGTIIHSDDGLVSLKKIKGVWWRFDVVTGDTFEQMTNL